MKLAFVSRTPLGGMPWRTMRVCDRHLGRSGRGWARSIVASSAYGPRSFPKDLAWGEPEAEAVLAQADVLILPAYLTVDSPPFSLRRFGKPVAIHYSTEPERWIERHPPAGSGTVVAQYQARHALGLDVLPNCIPIEDPELRPARKPGDRVVIAYTPSNRRGYALAAKGWPQTVQALRALVREHGESVEVRIVENAPYGEVLAAKREAHVVIDECVTGSYHASALEGLACGAVAVAWLDAGTREALARLFGPESEALRDLPLRSLPEHSLLDGLRELVAEGPAALAERGRAARAWMETWYAEDWQAQTWIAWHAAFATRARTLAV